MPRRSTAPRASTTSAGVAAICCAVVDGALAVLLREGSREGARSSLPYAALGAEAPVHSASQLVREGAGRAPSWIVQSATLSEGAHPSGAVLLLTYAACVPLGTTAREGHAWRAVADLPPLAPRELAAVESAVLTLRDRMDLVPVAFRLLPERFTLSELQQVYELLLGRRLHKASFRRALAGAALVEALDDWRSEGRGRPAQLHRFSPRRRRGVKRPVRFELLG
jgi:8-oxo-dGTP diphosphatase